MPGRPRTPGEAGRDTGTGGTTIPREHAPSNVGREYGWAVLKGLLHAVPLIGKAAANALSIYLKRSPDADELLSDLGTAAVEAAARRDAGRSQLVATLSPEVVAQASARALGWMGEDERAKVVQLADDLAKNGLRRDLTRVIRDTQELLVGSSALRHSLLSYAHEHLAQGRVLAPGERIAGRFEILEMLGHGGMGIVYAAHDGVRRTKVALKCLRADFLADPVARSRFEKEVNLALALTHPNIVRVYDQGQADDLLFMHMELVDGESLAEHLSAGPLPLESALAIARSFLSGLAHAHERGVLHLDIKPGNVLLGKNGEVKLADLGLARLQTREGMASMIAGQGTPVYMAPEQRLHGAVDARSDVFAAGVVLYEMIVGETPSGIPTPLPSSVPLRIREAILAALSQRADSRPKDAGDLLRRLDADDSVDSAPDQSPDAGTESSSTSAAKPLVITVGVRRLAERPTEAQASSAGSPSFAGHGKRVSPFFHLKEGLTVLHVTQTDSRTHVILRNKAGNCVGSILVPREDNSGSIAFRIDRAGDYLLSVDGDEGEWSITVEQ